MAVVGGATVELEADGSEFGPELERAINNALDSIVSAAQDAAGRVEVQAGAMGSALTDAARDGARQASAALQDVDWSNLDEAAAAADRLKESLTQARARQTAAAKEANAAEAALAQTMNDADASAEQIAQATQRAATARQRHVSATRDAAQAEDSYRNAAQAANSSTEEGASAASKMSEGLAGIAGKAAGAAVGLAGVASAAEGIQGAIERQQIGNTLAAQLGAAKDEAAKYGDLVGNVFADNFGSSMDQVSEAVGSVGSTFGKLGDIGESEMRGLSEKALTFSNVFGTDVNEAVQTASQLLVNGLAKDGTQAFDLLSKSFQQVPSTMREELPEILNEYGTNFRALGFSGEESFNVLVQAANNGKWALDKAGDSLKEFTIRASDGSASTTQAFQTLGLDANAMGSAVAAGGQGAQDALQKTIAKILEIPDPAKRAQTAIALFGTPLEDLSVDKIPQFLQSLQGGQHTMDGFAGSTDRMADTMNQGPAAALESLKRKIQDAIIDTFGRAAQFLTQNQWALYSLAGAVGALALAYGTVKAVQLGYNIATGISTGLTAANAAATNGSSIALTTYAIKAGAARVATLASAGAMNVAAIAAKAWAIAMKLLNLAFGSGPIGWIILAIGALVAVIVLIATKTDWFQKAWTWAWGAIKDAASAVWDWLKGAFDAIGAAFNWLWSNVISPVVDFIVGAFQFWWEGVQLYVRLVMAVFEVLWGAIWRIWDYAVKPVVDLIIGYFQFLWSGLQVVFGWIMAGLGLAWQGLQVVWETVIQPVLGWIGQGFQFLWQGIQVVLGWIGAGLRAAWSVLTWVWDTVVSPVLGWIGAAWQGLWNNVINPVINWIKGKFNDFATGIRVIWDATKDVIGKVTGKFRELLDFLGSIPGKVGGFFKDAGSWLYNAGKDIIQGLLNGAGSLLSKIGNFFLDKIPGWIKAPFKKALGIESPSKVFAGYGENIGQGLVNGVASMQGAVQGATQDLANSAADVSVPDLGAAVAPTAAVGATDAMSAPAAPVDGSMPTAGSTDPEAMGATWQASADAAVAVQTSTVDPMMAALNAGLVNYGLTVQTQLQGVVDPAWVASGTNLAVVKTTVIDPTLAGMNAGVATTAAVTQNAVFGLINPTWQNMGANVSNVMWGTVNPVMAAMRGAVDNTAAAFGNGASNIANQWNRVREATASPVRFAIGAVFNDGIVGMWNSVSDLLGTQKMSPYPIRFATGGSVPGSGNGDTVPALLTPKEFVVPKSMAAAIGGGNLDRGLSMLESARKRGPTPGLRSEGLFSALAGRYAGGGPVAGSPAWNAIKRGMGFAAKWNGRPYVWGGSLGPDGGTDCSGYMSSIADVVLGGNGLYRKWATGAFPGGGGSQARFANAGGQGWAGGLSAGMSIGVSPEHTAGTIGGFAGLPATNIESGGSHGNVMYGRSAAGADSGQFPTRYHLPIVNEMFMSGGGGGGGQDMGSLVGAITGQAWGKIMNAANGWKGGGYIGEYPTKLATKMKAVTQAKIDKLLEEMMADPGGAGAERWRPMAMRAMTRVGFNARDKRQVDAMIAQIQSESGGNPGIAQQIHDVNGSGEAAGVGLLQIIPSTFAAWRDPQLPDDRRNPFANMVAALRYYKGRYGLDLTSVWGHGHGYDLGGLATSAGLLPKHINMPERVLSPSQTRAFEQWMDAGSFAGDTYVMSDAQAQNLVQTVMNSMYRSGFSNSPDATFRRDAGGYSTPTTGSRTVLVNQYITGNDAQSNADEARDRLLALI